MPLREALAQHEAWLREQGILGKASFSTAWKMQCCVEQCKHAAVQGIALRILLLGAWL